MSIDGGSGWLVCVGKKEWMKESCVKCVLNVLNGCMMDVNANVGEWSIRACNMNEWIIVAGVCERECCDVWLTHLHHIHF